MKQLIIFTALLSLLLAGCKTNDEQDDGMQTEGTSAMNDTSMVFASQIQDSPHVVASDPIQAGRYLVIIGQCNDCHTDGYESGNVVEDDWLTGSSIGWHGPWGTTYPGNLRLRAQEWTEDAWVQTLKTRKALPPMPWINVNKISEQDMRAIYAYIHSLGPKGEHVPLAMAPNVTPQTPYISFFPQNLPTTATVTQ